LVADKNPNTALHETSTPTPAINPHADRHPRPAQQRSRSPVAPHRLESPAKGRDPPGQCRRCDQNSTRADFFGAARSPPAGADQTPPHWPRPPAAAESTPTLSVRRYRRRMVAPPGRGPAFTAAFRLNAANKKTDSTLLGKPSTLPPFSGHPESRRPNSGVNWVRGPFREQLITISTPITALRSSSNSPR
jgi:hypothetical protein